MGTERLKSLVPADMYVRQNFDLGLLDSKAVDYILHRVGT